MAERYSPCSAIFLAASARLSAVVSSVISSQIKTHARFGAFDLVMLEIGAFHPAWSGIHLGPQNALAAHALPYKLGLFCGVIAGILAATVAEGLAPRAPSAGAPA